MTCNVDDVHCLDSAFSNAMTQFNHAHIEPGDREKLDAFFRALRRDGLAKSTLVWYVNYTERMYQALKVTGFAKPPEEFNHDDFEGLSYDEFLKIACEEGEEGNFVVY